MMKKSKDRKNDTLLFLFCIFVLPFLSFIFLSIIITDLFSGIDDIFGCLLGVFFGVIIVAGLVVLYYAVLVLTLLPSIIANKLRIKIVSDFFYSIGERIENFKLYIDKKLYSIDFEKLIRFGSLILFFISSVLFTGFVIYKTKNIGFYYYIYRFEKDYNILRAIIRIIIYPAIFIIAGLYIFQILAVILIKIINIFYAIINSIIKLFRKMFKHEKSLRKSLRELNKVILDLSEEQYTLNSTVGIIKRRYRSFKSKYTKSESFTNYYTSMSYKISIDYNSLIIEMLQYKKPKPIEQNGRTVYFHNSREFPGGASFPVYVFSESFRCQKTSKGYFVFKN